MADFQILFTLRLRVMSLDTVLGPKYAYDVVHCAVPANGIRQPGGVRVV